MSPEQRAQIQRRLAAVAEERAPKLVLVPTPVTDKRKRLTPAQKQKAYRQREPEAKRAADTTRKRTARAKP